MSLTLSDCILNVKINFYSDRSYLYERKSEAIYSIESIKYLEDNITEDYISESKGWVETKIEDRNVFISEWYSEIILGIDSIISMIRNNKIIVL